MGLWQSLAAVLASASRRKLEITAPSLDATFQPLRGRPPRLPFSALAFALRSLVIEPSACACLFFMASLWVVLLVDEIRDFSASQKAIASAGSVLGILLVSDVVLRLAQIPTGHVAACEDRL